MAGKRQVSVLVGESWGTAPEQFKVAVVAPQVLVGEAVAERDLTVSYEERRDARARRAVVIGLSVFLPTLILSALGFAMLQGDHELVFRVFSWGLLTLAPIVGTWLTGLSAKHLRVGNMLTKLTTSARGSSTRSKNNGEEETSVEEKIQS